MRDLIKRKDVLDLIREVVECNNGIVAETGSKAARVQMNFALWFEENVKKIPRAKDKWYPLDEIKPLFNDDYLVCFDDGFVTGVHYDGEDWELWADSGEPVAWRFLPMPYEKGEKHE